MVNTYYDVLGVPIDADIATIKSAFRRAAKACHPDHHRTNSNSDQLFRRTVAAYAVLRDPMRRASYDQRLRDYLRWRRKRIIDRAIFSLIGTILLLASFLSFQMFGEAREIFIQLGGSVTASNADELQLKAHEVPPVQTSEDSTLTEILSVAASDVSKSEVQVPVETSEISKGEAALAVPTTAKLSANTQSSRTEVVERSVSPQVVAAVPRDQVGRTPGIPSNINHLSGAMRNGSTGIDQRRGSGASGNDPPASSAGRRSAIKSRPEKPIRRSPDTPSRLSYNRNDLETPMALDPRNSKRGFCLLEWRYYSPKVVWHIGDCGDGGGR